MRGMSLNGDGDGGSLRVSLLSDPAPVFNPRAERYARMLADAEQCGEGDGSKQPPQPGDEASERANMALYFVSLAKHARLPVHGTMRDYKFFHSATYRLCYFGVVALLLAIPLWTPASATDPTRSRGAHWALYLWLEAALLVVFFFDVRLQHKVMGGDSFWASNWIRLKVAVLAGVLVNLLVNTARRWPVYFMRPFMSLLLVERAKNVRRILENATLVLPRVVFVAVPMALVLIFTAAFAYVLFRGVDKVGDQLTNQCFFVLLLLTRHSLLYSSHSHLSTCCAALRLLRALSRRVDVDHSTACAASSGWPPTPRVATRGSTTGTMVPMVR